LSAGNGGPTCSVVLDAGWRVRKGRFISSGLLDWLRLRLWFSLLDILGGERVFGLAGAVGEALSMECCEASAPHSRWLMASQSPSQGAASD